MNSGNVVYTRNSEECALLARPRELIKAQQSWVWHRQFCSDVQSVKKNAAFSNFAASSRNGDYSRLPQCRLVVFAWPAFQSGYTVLL